MTDQKHQLIRRVRDAKTLTAADRLQLLQIIGQAGDDPQSIESLERRVTTVLGSPTNSYNTKVPVDFKTK